MAHETWYICDVCGKRVKSDDKEALESWMEIIIERSQWQKGQKPLLDVMLCGKKCAIKCVQGWLDEQDG